MVWVNGILTDFQVWKCILPLKLTINRTILMGNFNGAINGILMGVYAVVPGHNVVVLE